MVSGFYLTARESCGCAAIVALILAFVLIECFDGDDERLVAWRPGKPISRWRQSGTGAGQLLTVQ